MRLLTSVITVFLTLTVGLASPLIGQDLAPYLGKWQVDVPATIEAGKQSPRYNPEEHAKMAAMIERMLGSMTLTVDANTVTFARGSKTSESASFTLKSVADGVATVTVAQGEKHIELTFSLDEPTQRMRVKSSASRDMDFYVWKRFTGDVGESPSALEMTTAAVGVQAASPAKPQPTIEQNLKTILAAAEHYTLAMGVSSATYDALLKNKYFKPLQAVNGEDYSTVKIDLGGGTASVTDKDGVVHTAKKK